MRRFLELFWQRSGEWAVWMRQPRNAATISLWVLAVVFSLFSIYHFPSLYFWISNLPLVLLLIDRFSHEAKCWPAPVIDRVGSPMRFGGKLRDAGTLYCYYRTREGNPAQGKPHFSRIMALRLPGPGSNQVGRGVRKRLGCFHCDIYLNQDQGGRHGD